MRFYQSHRNGHPAWLHHTVVSEINLIRATSGFLCEDDLIPNEWFRF
jgi:hypothetical protein